MEAGAITNAECGWFEGASASLSCPDKQLQLQNYGKPTFVQPTVQGQLLVAIGKGSNGGKGVVNGHSVFQCASHYSS